MNITNLRSTLGSITLNTAVATVLTTCARAANAQNTTTPPETQFANGTVEAFSKDEMQNRAIAGLAFTIISIIMFFVWMNYSLKNWKIPLNKKTSP